MVVSNHQKRGIPKTCPFDNDMMIKDEILGYAIFREPRRNSNLERGFVKPAGWETKCILGHRLVGLYDGLEDPQSRLRWSWSWNGRKRRTSAAKSRWVWRARFMMFMALKQHTFSFLSDKYWTWTSWVLVLNLDPWAGSNRKLQNEIKCCILGS